MDCYVARTIIAGESKIQPKHSERYQLFHEDAQIAQDRRINGNARTAMGGTR
jgi:hypothetical protein